MEDEMNRKVFLPQAFVFHKKLKIALLSVVLTSLTLLGACDDGNKRKPDCFELDDDINALMDFEDCPTEGLVTFCNNYGCNFYEGEIPTSPLVLQGFTLFADCNVIDCFNIECEFLGTGEDTPPTGTLTIDEILGNSNFTGLSSFEDLGELAYQCSPIIAN